MQKNEHFRNLYSTYFCCYFPVFAKNIYLRANRRGENVPIKFSLDHSEQTKELLFAVTRSRVHKMAKLPTTRTWHLGHTCTVCFQSSWQIKKTCCLFPFVPYSLILTQCQLNSFSQHEIQRTELINVFKSSRLLPGERYLSRTCKGNYHPNIFSCKFLF